MTPTPISNSSCSAAMVESACAGPQQALSIGTADPPVAEPGEQVGVDVGDERVRRGARAGGRRSRRRVDRRRVASSEAAADLERAEASGPAADSARRGPAPELSPHGVALGAGLLGHADLAEQARELGAEQERIGR